MTHLEVQHKADIFKRQIIQRRQNLIPEAQRSGVSKMDARDANQQGESLDLTVASKEESKHSTTKESSRASKSKPKKSLSKMKKSAFSSSSSYSSSYCSSSSDSRYYDPVVQALMNFEDK
ncbi:cation channel sperm-associated protein 2 [Balaenoptera ricei]|uniref:cation channel sperm-associated protein 2 n=1 Tax=Balaenoptera ricei TaxID=2746895 RepID=UPI0028BEFBB2|nr:cation channel sperm-associated protein 2 [Balaenoptera ricei]